MRFQYATSKEIDEFTREVHNLLSSKIRLENVLTYIAKRLVDNPPSTEMERKSLSLHILDEVKSTETFDKNFGYAILRIQQGAVRELEDFERTSEELKNRSPEIAFPWEDIWENASGAIRDHLDADGMREDAYNSIEESIRDMEVKIDDRNRDIQTMIERDLDDARYYLNREAGYDQEGYPDYDNDYW